MGRWLATLVVLATALTLAPFTASPASADTPATDYTALPMVRYGDQVVDEDRGLLYLTGGLGDSRVVVMDAAGQVVHVLTDLPGATDMSLNEDGSRLFVGLSGAGAVAEVDTASWEEVHRWPVSPAEGVGEVAYVARRIWFSDGDSQSASIYVLNTTTGAVSAPLPRRGIYSAELLADQTRGRVIVADKSISTTHLYLYDAATRELVATRTIENGARWLVLHGDSVLVAEVGAVREYRLDDLGPVRATAVANMYPPRFSATDSLIASPTNHGVSIVDRDTSIERTVIAFPDAPDADVLDTVFVGDHLFAMSVVNGWLRLYRVDDPTVESADLSFYLPGPSVVGHAEVVGQLTDHGVGLAPARVTIKGPGGETVETVTEPDGSFHATVAPTSAGWYGYTATYAGDGEHPPAWTQNGAYVDKAQPVMIVHGPERTEPGESFVHTGTLSLNGSPMVGESVQGRSSCGDEAYQVTTDETGSWSMPQAPPRCTRSDYVFHFAGNSVATPATALRTVTTSWRTSHVALMPSRTVVPVDEPITFDGSVTVEGQPAADAAVTLSVTRSGESVLERHLMTDASGLVGFAWVPPEHGVYTAQLEFAADDGTLPATSTADVWVRRESTRLTLTGPPTAPSDGPLVLEGRLVDSSGAPQAGRSIDISRTEYVLTEPLTSVTTDADGRFTAVDPSPSRYATVYRASFGGERLLDEQSTSLRVAGRPQVVRIALDVPASVAAGDDLTVSGRLVTDEGPVPLAGVRLTAVDDSARPTTRVRELTTDTDGRFSARFATDVAGSWSLEAVHAPEMPNELPATAGATTEVVAQPGTLTLTPRASTVPAGGEVVVDGRLQRLDGTPEHTVVLVRRTSPSGDRVDLGSVSTAVDGTFAVRDEPVGGGEWTYRVTSLQRVVASQVAEVPVTVEPPVRTTITTTALGPDRRDGRYAVYRPSGGPLIRSITTPGAGRCTWFEAQRWRNRRWQTMERSTCELNTEDGMARDRLAGRRQEGSRWRVRAHVRATTTATAAASAWTYLRFERP